jgi:hypothetical protein
MKQVTITNSAAKGSWAIPVTAVASWCCDDPLATFKIALHCAEAYQFLLMHVVGQSC